jgi:hypothetical protein
MMRPAERRTAGSFRYATDRVQTSRDLGGVHLIFLTVWPDSAARQWIERDLTEVPAGMPAVLFVHDAPDVEAKHFVNPNGLHDINGRDRFENLLVDPFADGVTVSAPAVVERRALEAFLRVHPSITAYFHGDANWNQFYDWTGPGGTARLHTFRVDSPMKGAESSHDESKLSFQVAAINPSRMRMTVRECLWNAAGGIRWGSSATVSLRPPAAGSD